MPTSLQEAFDHLQGSYPEAIQVPGDDGEVPQTERQAVWKTALNSFTKLRRELNKAKYGLKAEPVVVVEPTMEQLKAPLLRKREAAIKELIRLIKKVKAKMADVPVSRDLVRIEQLEVEVSTLRTCWIETDKITQAIYNHDPACMDDQLAVQLDIDGQVAKPIEDLETKIKNCAMQCREAQAVTNREDATRQEESASVRVAEPAPSGRARAGEGRLKLEWIALLKFEGKIQDYPTFREDWKDIVSGELSNTERQRQIRTQVPKKDKMEVSGLKTMVEVWEYMDKEYGHHGDIITRRVLDLHNFQVSKNARTASAQFHELYAVWRKVFMTKFPMQSKREYITLAASKEMKGKELQEIMNTFMKEERERQRELEKYDALAISSKQLSLLGKQDPKDDKPIVPTGEKTCHICNKPGHFKKDCPQKKPGGGGGKPRPNQGKPNPPKKVNAAAGGGTCRVCNAMTHVWTNQKKETGPSTRLSYCPDFRALSAVDRCARIKDVQGCVMCLDWTGAHRADTCFNKKPCDSDVGGRQCGKNHHGLLHGAKSAYCNMAISVVVNKKPRRGKVCQEPKQKPKVWKNCSRKAATDKQSSLLGQSQGKQFSLLGQPPTVKEIDEAEKVHVLFPLQRVDMPLDIRTLVVFYDTGSNVSLCRTDWCKAVGLVGTEVVKVIHTASGQQKEWWTQMYHIPLTKIDGSVVTVLAMGLDQVTADIDKMDHSQAAAMFPEVEKIKLTRPYGSVDLLLGIHMAELFPTQMKESHRVGNLRLLSSVFGSGFMLDGAHPSVKPHGGEYSVQYIRGTAKDKQFSLLGPKAKGHQQVHHCYQLSFLEGEELGVAQPR